MSNPITISPEKLEIVGDTATRLYLTAASLRHLANSFPEEEDGLSHIIAVLGEEVQMCAAMLDDAAPPAFKNVNV